MPPGALGRSPAFTQPVSSKAGTNLGLAQDGPSVHLCEMMCVFVPLYLCLRVCHVCVWVCLPYRCVLSCESNSLQACM